MSAADALVGRLPRTTLVVGKGGVGKTTCAAALALRASAVAPTLVLSTDPARALPEVLDAPVGSGPTAVPKAPRLTAQSLDAGALRARFMERWGDAIRAILDRGTYLDDSDIGPMVETALPGSDEIFGALELASIIAGGDGAKRRLFVDTAPTGHTLRLLELPRTFRALVRLLDTMQGKHRFMVQTLTRRYRPDAADAFLEEMDRLTSALEDALRDARRCAVVLVTNGQRLVLAETGRYARALADLRVSVAAVVWNMCDASEAAPEGIGVSDAVPQFLVPRLPGFPVGRAGLERWSAELRPLPPSRPRPTPRRVRVTRRREPPASIPDLAGLVRPLTLVAGKGGVGKTTVAAAIAVQAARVAPTLVVSTDPAPSLADALAQDVPDTDVPVREAPGLFARQMDATAAFTRLRTEYQERVDALFAGLVASGVDLAHDRAITRDLLALAPPGLDEVYALSLIADALLEGTYAHVIVDPAPTGHFLRLLEMPGLALDWSHQLMRLMLKYKNVVGLGDAARDLLAFSRSVRALGDALRAPERCAVVLVLLDEPVVLAESRRLAGEIARRGVSVSGMVRNRAQGAASALPDVPGAMHLEAPLVDPPPIGARALRAWTASWR